MDKHYVESEADFWSLWMVILCSLAFGLNLVLLIFVELKEDPFFWRNAGGYPVWLRDLVLLTFYPLLTVQFLTLAASSICQFRVSNSERVFRVGGPLALALLWIFFTIIIAILITNNVDSLLHGHDLHYHPT